MKNVAIYTRISSSQQDQALQVADLKRWEAAHNVQGKWYHDTFTGKTMSRPAFESLHIEVSNRLIDTIVIWRLDRLGRTAAGLTKLFDELQTAGCNLISLKDSVDLSTPAGRLMANVIASVAQYETEVRRERQVAGIKVARAAGKKWGGSKPGRRHIEKSKISSIHQLKELGWTITAISRELRVSRPTIYSILREEAG